MKKRHVVLHCFAVLLLLAGIGIPFGSQVSAEPASNVLQVNNRVKLLITKKNGFVHPGISVDPYRLQETRRQLVKQKQPWTAYYQAMASSDYASTTFKASNLKAGTFDTPKDSTFKKSSQEMTLSADGFRAYTQAIMYYLTGNKQYRYNAIRLVRIWEHMDSSQFSYYADAHIHVPVPFYYMVSAAELLKYTTVNDPLYTDPDKSDGNTEPVNLNWTNDDNQKLIQNLIDPVMKTFLPSNNKYFNQHLYSITGVFAGSIFKNDKKVYDQAVEWAMVNANTDKPDINGSLANLFHQVDGKDPRNPIGRSYVQHLEMGRDQNHAKDDVLDLIGIARILSQQGTRIDPQKGTVSTAPKSQTPYEFLNNRLLAGIEQFYRYNAGYTIPWTQFAEDGGKDYPAVVANGTDKIIDYGGTISTDSRGRMGKYFSLSELYDVYRYQEHMSKTKLTKIAPSVVHAAENLSAPIFYDGTTLTNFWGSYSDNKMTEIGCEYWLSIPTAIRKDSSVTLPVAQPSNSNVSFSKRGTILDRVRAKFVNKKNTSFVRVQAVKNQKEIKETDYDRLYPKDKTTVRGGNQIALSSLVKGDGDAGYVTLRIRSNGKAKLLISGGNSNTEPYQQVEIPDTKGQWINLVYSTRDDELSSRTAKQLGYMDFYAVIAGHSSTHVDFDQLVYINRPGGIQTSVPAINEPDDATNYLIKNSSFEKKLDTTNTAGAVFSLEDAPDGMKIDQRGVITWTPNERTAKPISVLVRVVNNGIVCTKQLNFAVEDTRAQALQAVLDAYDATQTYTSESVNAVKQQQEKVEELLKQDNDAVFLETLQTLADKIDKLELLNPKLSDGSLNYNAYDSIVATVTGMAKSSLGNLIDDDPVTYDGNLLTPIIFDFGEHDAISASSFAFEARTGFPNRLQGANVYGSSDGLTWTLMTTRPTSQTNSIEKIAVKDGVTDKLFRYIKLQVDEPGPDTDPAYPGISSRGEFHIFGIRYETQ
ncbi:hypothetical protein NIE88_02635 [Sporolactobacillus shoreicorticis]|uniref:Alginate lyase domain-containing protein n=1 Tax=Sporolactobacillus shoreicorticis TaxID=1923877 RepID=A0ABW5S0Y7_9BACL|nr:hypothetical protein [Sporolactobacillus shoreicorticis]MCO7124675.1 hypothetical protein [Sporolactobacillus shoreicorticis]